MSYGSAHLMHAIFDALRYAMWAIVSGFAVVGAAFYGGAGVAAAWQRLGPPVQRDDDVVRREAAKGIAEIETFLAAPSAREIRREPPPARPRKLPPASGEAA